MLTDLGKVLDLADRLLGDIDRIVEAAGAAARCHRQCAADRSSRSTRPILPIASAASSHILVVDDNVSNRDLLSRRLVREGHRVTAVESGEAALALTAAESFDLVLLDLMMPGMSGFEVLCRLKSDARTRHRSGHHDLGARRARQHGALH